MTFKPNAVKRTVTGTFQRPDGVASEGSIFVQLSRYVKGRQENTVYTPQEIEIPLDETGSFSEDLAVTAPGLTTEELAELNSIQTQREQNLADLAAVSELIGAYLKKLAANQAVTEAETTAYNENIAEKKRLQDVSISLSQDYNEMLDLQKNLEDNVVRMRVKFNLSNPKNTSKMDVIIPPGTEPIDIADLPRI